MPDATPQYGPDRSPENKGTFRSWYHSIAAALCATVLSVAVFAITNDRSRSLEQQPVLDAPSTSSQCGADSPLRIVAAAQQSDGSWSDYDDSHGDEPCLIHQELCTSLAILDFLGQGYDSVTPNRYKMTVKRGLDWILATQHDDGSFPGSTIEQSRACCVLCEDYSLSNDPKLRDPARRAIRALLDHRCTVTLQAPLLAWRDDDGRLSTRTNVFCILAIKDAYLSEVLDDQDAFIQARAWLSQSWQIAIEQAATSGVVDPRFPEWIDVAGSSCHASGSDPVGALVASLFLSIHYDQSPVATLLPQMLAGAQRPEAGLGRNAVERWLSMIVLLEWGPTDVWKRWHDCTHDFVEHTVMAHRSLQWGLDYDHKAGGPVMGNTSSSLLLIDASQFFRRSRLSYVR